MRLAVFVSPHGFGHAARTCALLDALAARVPRLEPVLFTTVPRWFFTESLAIRFDYRPIAVDVGVVQTSPLDEDLPATVRAVGALLAEAPAQADALARELRTLGCRAVLADIAPLGLLAARRAGLPAVLIESFTWDWIYARLVEREPALAALVEPLAALFALADHRLTLEPACERSDGAVGVPPVARTPRHPEAVRQRLGLDPDRPLVVVSFGGIPRAAVTASQRGTARPPGASAGEPRPAIVQLVADPDPPAGWHDDVLLLPHHAPVYHPDLVAAADVVVSKLGYSTVAECWRAGTRLLYVGRPGFPESPMLARFADAELTASPLAAADDLAAIATAAAALLARPRRPPATVDGAVVAASQLEAWLC